MRVWLSVRCLATIHFHPSLAPELLLAVSALLITPQYIFASIIEFQYFEFPLLIEDF